MVGGFTLWPEVQMIALHGSLVSVNPTQEWLMTKCLHLITPHSKKTFWTPDKSITEFSLRGIMCYICLWQVNLF